MNLFKIRLKSELLQTTTRCCFIRVMTNV